MERRVNARTMTASQIVRTLVRRYGQKKALGIVSSRVQNLDRFRQEWATYLAAEDILIRQIREVKTGSNAQTFDPLNPFPKRQES